MIRKWYEAYPRAGLPGCLTSFHAGDALRLCSLGGRVATPLGRHEKRGVHGPFTFESA